MNNLKFNLGEDAIALHLAPSISIFSEFNRLNVINDDVFEHNDKVLCDKCYRRISPEGLWAHKSWCDGRRAPVVRKSSNGKTIISDKEKELIKTRYFVEGMRVPDIVNEFGVTRYTVYHHLRMARKTMSTRSVK